MNKPNNTPAFPIGITITEPDGGFLQEGMTLRDYFAGQALAGDCATESGFLDNRERAIWAYKQADEMLKARVS